MDKICAIVLAGGKGTRMGSTITNKVAELVSGKPIIQRNIEVLRKSGIQHIVVVVGFAKKSIIPLLDKDILIAQQLQAQGTGDATKIGLTRVPEEDFYILVVYGDDAFWFTPEVLNNLYLKHLNSKADLTFCTTEIEDPKGLGRIIRDEKGVVVNIIEDKVATEEQKQIREVNIGGYLFNKTFLSEHINSLQINKISGEYYLTDLIPLASQNGAKIETLKLENFTWRGINTPEELEQAEKLLK